MAINEALKLVQTRELQKWWRSKGVPDAPYEGGVEKGSPFAVAMKIAVAFVVYYEVPYAIGEVGEVSV